MFSGAPHCSTCTRVLDASWIDPDFVLHKRRFDLSTTYDGAVIASDAFIDACDDIPGVTFLPLPTTAGFAVMRVDRVVYVDAVANRTEFGELCQECGEPRYVICPGPLYLADGQTIERGFSRTNLGYGATAHFGRNQPNHLAPEIVVDADTARALEAAQLLGVHLVVPS
jgi:hypothetical protein